MAKPVILLLNIILSLLFFRLYAEKVPSSGFFAEGGVLCWQAEEGGLAYAIQSTSSHKIAGQERVFDFAWDFGFNLGLGYRIPHDCLQALLLFTSFQTHADSKTQAEELGVLFPVWSLPTDPNPAFVDEALAHWRLHFGVIDLLLSRPFYPLASFALTPQIGVRWASIRQKFDLEYRLEKGVAVHMKNKYQGLGPYLGLKCQYFLGKGWSLLASTAASLLYGEFYIHQRQVAISNEERAIGLHSIYRSSSAALEAVAGISWEHLIDCGRKKIVLDLAWDQRLFFSQNQLLYFADQSQLGIALSNQGDLAIAGAHFDIRLDF